MPTFLNAFVEALIISFLLTPYIKKLAQKTGAVDAPDARKVHKAPMPRLGGLAIFAGFMVAVLLAIPLEKEIIGLLMGATTILLVGIIDDIKQLSAKTKLVGQIISALVLIMFDVRIDWLTNPLDGGMIYTGDWAILLTVFWIVGVTNTINLIDGLDGLAAGVSTIAAVTILFVSFQHNSFIVAVLTAAIAGSSLGFLYYNFNPAQIFMGDTGSLFLGYVLAATAVIGTVKSAATIALIVPFVALGLPIMDTANTIVRRFISGSPIFKPDKGHIHHRLLAAGLSQRQAVLVLYFLSASLGISAIMVSEAGTKISLLLLLFWVAIACFIFKPKTLKKYNRSA